MTTNIFKVDNVLLNFNTKCINIKNDQCPICRNNLLDKCIECQVNIKESKECKSVLGCCGHGYHVCCIDKWCKTRDVCPLDNEEWLPISYV
jgi:RING-box protein 1